MIAFPSAKIELASARNLPMAHRKAVMRDGLLGSLIGSLLVGVIAIAGCSTASHTSSEATGKRADLLTEAQCDSVKASGDYFPQCTNRSAEAEAVWPAAQDPVEDYPEGDDDATRAIQDRLCQGTYAWFSGQDPRRLSAAQAVCLGNDANLTAYALRALKEKSDQVPRCTWLKMSYALDTPAVPYDANAVDANKLKTHFSPCRNRLFMQCLLHGKVTRGKDATGADLGGFARSPIWTLGPTDAAVASGDPLDVTARGAANLISFTSSEMCTWRSFTGSLPTTSSPKQSTPD